MKDNAWGNLFKMVKRTVSEHQEAKKQYGQKMSSYEGENRQGIQPVQPKHVGHYHTGGQPISANMFQFKQQGQIAFEDKKGKFLGYKRR